MIMAREIETEGMLERGLEVLICDRTILDHWAYTEVLFPAECPASKGRPGSEWLAAG